MIKQDQEWNKIGKQMENIKEMGDVTSGMASTIVQIYLKQILEAFLHSNISVAFGCCTSYSTCTSARACAIRFK